MLRLTLLAALLLLPIAARAEPTASCTPLFAGGQAPSLLNPRLAERTHPRCYRAYAVLDSGLTRGPLWSAEHPTAAGLAGAGRTPRINLFHPELELPTADRAELADYARSGFDRGHMTPSGDMPDAEAQEQSFTLANMVPQTPELNRGIWERIESAARGLVRRQGEAYIVTGPAFAGANLQQIGGRVLVPSSTWKAIYVPATGEAGAVLARSFFYLIAPPIIHGLIAGGQQHDDGEDHGWAGWAAEHIALGLVSGIPVVRDVASAIGHGTEYRMSPAADAIGKAMHAGKDVGRALGLIEGEPSDRWVRHAIETPGYFLGLPTGQAAGAGQFLWDVWHGDEDPHGVAEWTRGIMYGPPPKGTR